MAPRIWYVDLTRAKWTTIEEALGKLARARGVVFDLRGYPSEWDVTINIIRCLLKRMSTSVSWYRTPKCIYPDRERLVGYEPGGWCLGPIEPRIRGRVAVLTDASTWSQPECIVGYFVHHKLGTTIGQTTAGSNGDVAEFRLPGGFKIVWTGARVVRHDGSRFHRVGFRPDVSVKRTMRGVIQGRDEFVEKAVATIENLTGNDQAPSAPVAAWWDSMRT